MLPRKRLRRFNRRRRYWQWYLMNEQKERLAGDFGIYQTLGSISGAQPGEEYISRKVAPEGFTGPINVTSGNGLIALNGEGNWSTSIVLEEGDYYQAKATSAVPYDGIVILTVDVPDSFTITTRSLDITPNPFPFTDVTGAVANTLITSDPVTVNGMDDGCPTSVADGEYDINQSGVWLTGASTINEGDQIRVRRYSGDETYLDPDGNPMLDPDGNPISISVVSATMTVGTVSEVFTISTEGEPGIGDGSPAQVYFDPLVNQIPGATVQSNSVTVLDINIPIDISISAGTEYRVNGGAWTSVAGTVVQWDTVELQATAPAGGLTDTHTLTLGDTTADWQVTSEAAVVSDAFEFVMRTTGASETITLPFTGVSSIDIDWGDGNVDTGVTTDNPSHQYASADDYDVSVTGSMTNILFDGSSAQDKIISVSNLGDLGLTYLNSAFRDCGELVSVVAGDSDLSGVTQIDYAFYGCVKLVSVDLTGVDLAINTRLSWVFGYCTALTTVTAPGLSTATNTRLDGVFGGCTLLTTIDISGWVTSGVNRANECFNNVGATSLDVSNWDTTNITTFYRFARNTNLNLDISHFILESTTTMDGCMQYSNFSSANYDLFLSAAAGQAPNLLSSVPFNAGDAQYTEAAAKAVLEGAPYLWIIGDGGPA